MKQALSRAARRFCALLTDKPVATALLFAVFTNLLIYALHMRSPIGGLLSLLDSPLHAILNALILFFCFCIPLFFRRRLFGTALIFAVWTGLGVADCVLLGMRISPLEAIDFAIVQTGLAIVTVYLSVFEILLIGLAIFGAVAALVWLFFKLPKKKPNIRRALLCTLCAVLALVILIFSLSMLDAADPAVFKNTVNAYRTYGFPYCFLWSCFDRGIDRPEDYSEERIGELLRGLAEDEQSAPSRTPNIVFVQLESTFDITRYTDIALSEDPIPNLRGLRSESVFGLLTVPSVGAGTANTEFEVLTGLPIAFFGAGEYPYETILSQTACESVAYQLGAHGYATHAIHNHTATFYDRHLVYANLGFDVFTGAEFIPNLTKNALGWEKDEVLTELIMDSLAATQTKDFVFAVSVQAHGRYPQVGPEGEERLITVGSDLPPEQHNAVEYYANQLYEVDRFVGDLVTALRSYDEEVILVLYGDHLPALNIPETSLSEGDLFTSDYLIWSNCGLIEGGSRVDLAAYELSAAVCELFDLDGGLISRVHASYRHDEQYLELLRLAGYDLLYGDYHAFGGVAPYTPSDMRLGLYDIRITAVESLSEETHFLLGENFTKSSRVYVNGKPAETVYVDKTRLYLPKTLLQTGDSLSVIQISADLQKLSESKPYIIMR